MYVPAHFALPTDACIAILSRLGAADLITVHEDGPDATYLPLDYVPAGGELPGGGAAGPLGSLVGHVARNNQQASRTPSGPALVIAHAGDHYVSPIDLPSHADHGKIVPTWDYVTVHAYGELVHHEDPDWLLATMRTLTDRHEADWAVGARGSTGPGGAAGAGGPGGPGETWTVEDAPREFVDRMVRAVVGLEVQVTRLVGKAKMSQNKAPADVEGEIAALSARGLDGLAAYKRDVSLPAAIRRRELLADVGRRHREKNA